MHVPQLIQDLVLVLAASLPVVFICQRIGLPAVVGLIVTGMLLGPSTTALVASTEHVTAMAEIGVVLLLFTIGLEFSIARLKGIAGLVLRSGTVQVVGVAAVVAGIALLRGYEAPQALVFGFVAALSSTAIALKLLADRDELETEHGRIALGILLFQDLSVVPMLLLLPGLASAEAVSWTRTALSLFYAAAGAAALIFAARLVLPWLFREALRLRSRELFMGAMAVSCFGTAWLTASLGISLAIGAFLAGLIVSESEYSHQVIADVLPLRDLFSSIFFISIGMLVDFEYVRHDLARVLAVAAGFVSIKVVLTAFAVLLLRPSLRLGLLVGAALGQVGEFSFVVTEEARTLGLLASGDFHAVLGASVVTMMIAPLMLRAASSVTHAVAVPGNAPAVRGGVAIPVKSHVVIIGYGFNGRNLARVLRETSIPYVVVEYDAEAVRRATAERHPVLYGDATRPVVLESVHVDQAVVIVVAMNDHPATRRIVKLVRDANPKAALVVRTRNVAEVDELYRLGVDEVIPEEMETSVELFARVLQCLDVPENVVAAQVDVVRSEHYAMLRGTEPSAKRIERIYELFTAATTTTHLLRGGSPAIGKAVGVLDMRTHTGATLLAVVRKDRATTNPADDFVLERGDILVVLGNHPQLAAARRLLEPQRT